MLPFRRRKSAPQSRMHKYGRARRFAGPERLEDRLVFSTMPLGSMPDDTAEFMLGEVYVTVVLMESSSQTSAQNNNSETWNSASIAAAKQRINEGLQWWEDTLATVTNKHHLNFQIDYTYADAPVSTGYEPITRSSNDFQFWIYDFLNKVNFNTRGNYHSDIRAFNHAQRVAHDTDWAFTIFVVNDENDSDHQFAPGGFSRAFAFAGGEFLVSPASRPASTFAHETGHIFWAYDEYQPDGNYNRRRGYYNTQNLNSWDNPTPGFVQQPSIMTKDQLLTTAYANHSSAASTLEMVGWKDSDSDGIFDVLDVPLTLNGSGYYDSPSGEYRFTGTSAVQTIPNKNTSGLKNDITINQVSRAQYRIDGGAWQTAATFGTYTANLNLRIPTPVGASTVEIRTIDDATGVSSAIFQGLTSRPSSTLTTGISGVVWQDADRDGALDPSERGLANVTVQAVDANGQPLQLRKTVEPDSHASTTRINTVNPAVSMSAVGGGVADDTVASFAASSSSTGDRLFASFSSSCGGYCADWTTESRNLRLDFTSPISTISLDAIGSTFLGIGRLEAYSADNQLLARYTTRELPLGQVETMTLTQRTPNIKYVIARSHNNTEIRLDNLRFGPQATVTTDANGTYTIADLSAGQYRIQVVTGSGQRATNPVDGSQNVILAEGEAKAGVDFGIENSTSQWQNSSNPFDVNNDGSISPNDVLRIINKLNAEGARPLVASDTTPPFLDVNGDLHITSNDALQVINAINSGSGGGEGESFASKSFTASSFSSTVPSGSESEGEANYGPLIVIANRSSSAAVNSTVQPDSESQVCQFSHWVMLSEEQESATPERDDEDSTDRKTSEEDLLDHAGELIDDDLLSLLAAVPSSSSSGRG